MKNLHLYIPQFFGFDETLIAFILASKSKTDLDSLNDWLSDKNFVSEISSWFLFTFLFLETLGIMMPKALAFSKAGLKI